MNPSDGYWTQPQLATQYLQPLSNTSGFLFNLPYTDPVSEAMSFGEGRQDILGNRELIFTHLPEMRAVGNVLPSTAGYPRVDPNSFHGSFRRDAFVKKV